MLAFQRNTFCVRQVDGGKSFGESSFVIKTDPEIKTLKPTTTSSGLFGGSSYKSTYSKSEMPEKKASLLAPNVLLGRTNSANFASSSSTFETTTKRYLFNIHGYDLCMKKLFNITVSIFF